jgi:hypothetical protein
MGLLSQRRPDRAHRPRGHSGCARHLTASSFFTAALTAKRIDDGEVTIGKVIDAESEGASSYPNNVRYGDLLQHFQPLVVAQMASMVAAFADKHWQTIRAQ